MEEKHKAMLEEADWFFRKMVRRFVKERDKISVEGVTLPGLMVLHKLIKEGEQRLGDLAEELDLTSGAITALCDRLEELEFAVRRRSREDRRAVVLDITAKGRAVFLRNRNIGQRCITVLFGGFSEEELNEQIRYFRRITGNLQHFSETILRLAEENAGPQKGNGNGSRTENEPPSGDKGGRYLTY